MRTPGAWSLRRTMTWVPRTVSARAGGRPGQPVLAAVVLRVNPGLTERPRHSHFIPLAWL